MTYALITGASSGIGKALAYEFAKNKINLVLIARSGDKLKEISDDIEQQFGVKCLFIAADLVHHTVPYEIRQKCHESQIEVEYLVNNAGFGDYGSFLTSSSQKDLGMIDLNIRSLTIMTKLFLPDMVARGRGKIMNVSSTAAFQPGPNMAVYFASKAYVQSFSEALAEELVGTGVTVTALCPGATQSLFRQAANATASGLARQTMPTSEAVASYGYAAMMHGRRIAIHGWKNNMLLFLNRLAPRTLVVKIVKKMLT